MDLSKRYLLFSFDEYYPSGGMNDCEGSFDSVEEAEVYANTSDHCMSCFQIVDTQTRKIVKGF